MPCQPHGNRKNKLLAYESVYWVHIHDDIENHIKMFANMPYNSADTTKGQDDTS